MDYDAILAQVVALLRQQKRLSYRVLKLRLQLDDDTLEALKEDLIYAKHLATDEDGRVLVWTGGAAAVTPPGSGAIESSEPPDTVVSQDLQAGSPSPAPRPPQAERRQLTVLFCDLADSTALASQLDPGDWREVVRAYQEACAKVIARYEGHIAQYLGDGLLVYFGYPRAHDDDAQRAVRAGLGMVEAVGELNTRLGGERGVQLAVRLGIHTGLVVGGEVGSSTRQEPLALGETPNVAARRQSLRPGTVAISDTTHRLVRGYVRCETLGLQRLKGVETSVRVYRVVGEGAAQRRLEVAAAAGRTPLVGRAHEGGLLRERGAQSQEGRGQVVLLSGEAGIGQSRLVRVLSARAREEGAPRLTRRCAPSHTNSAFYPVIEHLQRRPQWHREQTPAARLATLEQALRTAGLPLAEVVALLAALLRMPVPARYPPLSLRPQRQKQKTQEARVAWLLAAAAQRPVLAVWEALHWADPSTREGMARLPDHVPTARLLLVLTARPAFRPPWVPRSYMTQLTLTRLTRPQSEAMVLRVTGGSRCPPRCSPAWPRADTTPCCSCRPTGCWGRPCSGVESWLPPGCTWSRGLPLTTRSSTTPMR